LAHRPRRFLAALPAPGPSRFDIWERPFYPLAIPLAPPIGRHLREGPASASRMRNLVPWHGSGPRRYLSQSSGHRRRQYLALCVVNRADREGSPVLFRGKTNSDGCSQNHGGDRQRRGKRGARSDRAQRTRKVMSYKSKLSLEHVVRLLGKTAA